MDVARERGDDNLSGGARDHILNYRTDVFFERGEARNIGVGGVAEEQVEAFFTNLCEGTKVGEPAVKRNLVHLEVTCVKNRTPSGANDHGERIWNGVIHCHEFEIEAGELFATTLGNHHAVRSYLVLFELGLNKGEG